MSINYTTYVSQIANLTVLSSADPNFQTMLPGMIDYAEQRIYREGDFLATYGGGFVNCVAGANVISLPAVNSNTLLVLDSLSAITPVSTSTSSNSVIHPLQVASRHFIDNMFPQASMGGLPKYFNQVSDTVCYLGPTPDQNYLMGISGTFRPTPLSVSNSSTFLTQTLPDLFIAGSMIFASGYMRNFGSQADDAAMAVSWSKQYDILFASAGMEELRKKYSGQAWQSQIPNPIATPPRV